MTTQQQAPEEIIKKIEKLLKLGQSNNENEARLALERANELMIRFNLSTAQVQGFSDKQKYTHYEEFCEDLILPVEYKYVFGIIQTHFFVKVVTSKKFNPATGNVHPVHHYLATEANLKMARYVDQFIFDAMTDGWDEYREKTGARAGAKQSYYLGFYNGLDAQLASRRKVVEKETGLMVIEDKGLVKFTAEKFPRLRTSSGGRVSLRDSGAYSQGSADGKNLKITPGIESNPSNGRRLLS